ADRKSLFQQVWSAIIRTHDGGDASFAHHFRGEREPPDSINCEALEDAIGAIARDQERAGLDIISDGRIQGDNYGDILYYYYRCMGYSLRGGLLGFPIYSRL